MTRRADSRVVEAAIEAGDGGESDEEGGGDVLLDLLPSEANGNALLGAEDAIPEVVPIEVLAHAPDIAAPTLGDPPDWVRPEPKTEQGEPAWDKVDNPFGAGSFVLRPVFAKTGDKQYLGHALPTKAMAVPAGADGKRSIGGWDFHYGDVADTGVPGLSHVTHEIPFPKEREGCLDQGLLKKMDLTPARMQEGDALFFRQLLLPMCDPRKSGIEGDPRTAYYTDKERFTNLYATRDLGLGGSYGHPWSSATAAELVRWDGVIARDAALGSSRGALYRRFEQGCSKFDELTYNALTNTRFLQLKRTQKLCDNASAPQRGEEGYDPCYKYAMIYDAVVSNTNSMTEKGGLDAGADETSWANMGFGEKGAGTVGRIVGKPGITKGGQDVLFCDRDRIRVRACIHRHKLHVKHHSQTGPNEVRLILEKMKSMVVGQPEVPGVRQIYDEFPASTWDNLFSGEQITEDPLVKALNIPLLHTARRDRLPKGVPDEYLCKAKTAPGDARARAARFVPPITLTQGTKVHISFQSTSSCNLGSVNMMSEVRCFVTEKGRGRGDKRRVWYIENNTGRRRYLGTYWVIDRLDHLIGRQGLCWVSWKYWHAPMRHATSIADITAYSMYQECAEGGLDPAWKVEKPLGFWAFCDKLAVQLLEYDPRAKAYPGDSAMRAATRLGRSSPIHGGGGGAKRALGEEVGAAQIAAEVKSGRLVGDMTLLMKHVDAAKPASNTAGKVCKVCGELSATECSLCKVALHLFPQRGKAAKRACYIQYHDTAFFGLAKCDLCSGAKFAQPGKRRRQQYRAGLSGRMASGGGAAAAAAATPAP